MDWNAIEAVGTVCAAGIAAVALVMTAVLQRQQFTVSREIHREQQLLSQRQLLLPLWEHLGNLSDINPAAPVWPDVVKAVNTLELVAVLYEGGMIDRAVIDRTFAPGFLHLARRVQMCTIPPPGGKSGPEMLAENRSALLLFRKFEADDAARGKLNPL